MPAFEPSSDEVTVIIETPKGSRNKYAFDGKARIFDLKQVLPSGMAFPHDFGLVQVFSYREIEDSSEAIDAPAALKVRMLVSHFVGA